MPFSSSLLEGDVDRLRVSFFAQGNSALSSFYLQQGDRDLEFARFSSVNEVRDLRRFDVEDDVAESLYDWFGNLVLEGENAALLGSFRCFERNNSRLFVPESVNLNGFTEIPMDQVRQPNIYQVALDAFRNDCAVL